MTFKQWALLMKLVIDEKENMGHLTKETKKPTKKPTPVLYVVELKKFYGHSLAYLFHGTLHW